MFCPGPSTCLAPQTLLEAADADSTLRLPTANRLLLGLLLLLLSLCRMFLSHRLRLTIICPTSPALLSPIVLVLAHVRVLSTR